MDNFEKLTSPSLKDLFVSRIAGLILSGKLRVGEKFPPERTLAEQLGVTYQSVSRWETCTCYPDL